MANTRDPELVILLNSIAISCKLISSAVSRAGVAKLYGLAGEVNSTGDDQKKLDVLSNDMMINALVHSGVCSVLVSEENEEPIIVSKFEVSSVIRPLVDVAAHVEYFIANTALYRYVNRSYLFISSLTNLGCLPLFHELLSCIHRCQRKGVESSVSPSIHWMDRRTSTVT